MPISRPWLSASAHRHCGRGVRVTRLWPKSFLSSTGELDLRQLGRMEGSAARSALIRVHGIGPWTADVYLLMALRQPDVWPHGDLALAKAVMQVKRLRRLPSYEKLSRLAEQWSPWRAVAARIAWHHYLSSR